MASARAPEGIEAKRALVERIAASSLFQKSPRLREFLLYVADCTLEGRPDEAREQAIAERLFHRSSDYAGQDSIVRAEARNLRKRLDLYFAADGKNEPMVVEMPKGGYLLTFVLREVEPEDSLASDVPAVLPPTSHSLSTAVSFGEPAARRKARWLGVACALVTMIAILAMAGAYRMYRINSELRAGAFTPPPGLPFSAILGNSLETMIVTSDTTLVPLFYSDRSRISLDDYITRSYPKSSSLFPTSLTRAGEYTDAQEVALAGQIIHANAAFARGIRMRSGHQVQLSDVKNYNMILLGSSYSNPWVQMFENKLNFRLDLNPKAGGLIVRNGEPQGDPSARYSCRADLIIRNSSPKPGESGEYPCSDHNQSYAAIAFLPAESGSGHVLLIAGTTAESTAAGGEFVLDDRLMRPALQAIGVDSKGAPHFFELLLRVNAFVGGATRSEIVAARAHPVSNN